jgi:ubiquitin carboxyl-terminal hydrolase 10
MLHFFILSTLPPSGVKRAPTPLQNTAPAILITPRGLTNTGNTCFMNVILQSLLFCPPFYSFFTSSACSLSTSPLIAAVYRFLDEFETSSTILIDPRICISRLLITVESSDAFVPKDIYDILRKLVRTPNTQKGRQEDAAEFLGFLLDGLHEELASLGNTAMLPDKEVEKEDGWITPRSSVTTRVAEIKQETVVSRLFSGRTRSVLRVEGGRDSATLEPFSPLQLEIAGVQNVEDAIKEFSKSEVLEDYTSSKGDKVLRALICAG